MSMLSCWHHASCRTGASCAATCAAASAKGERGIVRNGIGGRAGGGAEQTAGQEKERERERERKTGLRSPICACENEICGVPECTGSSPDPIASPSCRSHQ